MGGTVWGAKILIFAFDGKQYSCNSGKQHFSNDAGKWNSSLGTRSPFQQSDSECCFFGFLFPASLTSLCSTPIPGNLPSTPSSISLFHCISPLATPCPRLLIWWSPDDSEAARVLIEWPSSISSPILCLPVANTHEPLCSFSPTGPGCPSAQVATLSVHRWVICHLGCVSKHFFLRGSYCVALSVLETPYVELAGLKHIEAQLLLPCKYWDSRCDHQAWL